MSRLFACAIVAGLAGAVLPVTSSTAAEGIIPQAEQTPAERALKQAADTGRRVEVVSERTEYSTTFANPEGTFTQETHVVPIRVRQNGRLVTADPTLVKGKDGVVRPRASAVGIEFSGGGAPADAPMVTITRDGRSMSLDWPGTLPEPVLDGDTATYPEVLPGVDLKLRASVTGFQQVLVVKSREAAAHPQLKRLSYSLRTDGVRARTDEAGNLTAVNPAGQEVFTAPTPLMWDSSGVPDGAAPSTLRSAGEALAAPQKTQGAKADAANSFDPAIGAKQAALPAKVEDGALKLTPDEDLLTSPDTVYPVHIDPYVSGGRNNWAAVSKNYPTTSYWNKSDNVARVGYESQTGTTWRSFFTMDSRNLHGKKIVRSTFRIKNTHSWSCTKKPVTLYLTGSISSSTTWNKQPSWSTAQATVTDSKGWSSSCPAGNLEFSTLDAATKASANKWNTITLGLKANESDTYGWKKFDASTAVISTEYNTPPAAPSALDTIPSTRNSAGCGDTAPYGYIGDTDIYLTAKASDPDGGTVNVKFHLWATGHHPNDDPNGVLIVNQTVSVTSGSVAKLKVAKSTLLPHLQTADGNFSWKAQASDGSLSSDWTPPQGAPGCRFVFDPERPSTPPTVSSVQFPNGDDGWPVNTSPVRTTGQFVVTPGGATDVAAYEYWSTQDTTVRTATPATLNGTVTIELTPTKAGAHYLYVRSVDRAQNKSDLMAYLFYVNGAAAPDKPGDLNGDGHPDLWAVDGTGTLQRYFGDGTGTAVKASQAASANGQYTDTKTTRRGDWTDDGFEDLIVLKHDATEQRDRLWVHANDGTGGIDQANVRELNVWGPENDHWQGADQILAIGDVDGPLDLDGDGTIGPNDRPGHPDLLVRKGDQLWLYFGSPSGYLDEYVEQPPVLIGDEGWSGLELFAPGDATGDGRVDLIARDTSTGVLYRYNGTGPNGEGLGADPVQIGTSWTLTNRPLVTSVPDVQGDGQPSVWATDASGNLLFYPQIKGGGNVVGSGLSGFRSLT
ncbi:FG-GAP-like repeat-containing protein [Streptomyces sp. LB8]|uniref:FG-GAP-like repeat-containing protein n=1 Tax=Streptomyces sp. LB8 TaxID=3042509 RepID=UPI00264A1359|nr:FG-GAP-like repeat-containing protein [Streptomyces sp. LB8]MDN5384865.1 FG-GAP-like repeat-containing protein [Streptomyces sp. LB8]